MNWLTRRFTVVVAAAGYGKTSLVRDRLRDASTHWCAVDALPADLPDEPTWVVVDDLPPLGADLADALTGYAEALPRHARLVLIGRTRPDALPLSRWRGRGDLAELGPADLALTVDTTTAVLRHEYATEQFAAEVHAATGGWPALVHLLGRGPRDKPHSAVRSYLAEEVLSPLDPEVRQALSDAVHLDLLVPELLAELGHAPSMVELLARIGLLRPASGVQPGHRLLPLVTEVVTQVLPSTEDRRRELRRTAAWWYEGHDLPVPAMICSENDVVRLLAAQGEKVLVSGGASRLIEAVEVIPAGERTEWLRMLHGEALYMTGDTARAIEMLSTLDAVAPRVAWRLGHIHYLGGDPHTALAILNRAAPDGARDVDLARLHGWTATVHWLLADVESCRQHADLAMRAAQDSADPAAFAIAHVARALLAKISGDPAGNIAHYERALHFAELARDAVQSTRIRCNTSSRLCDDAQYAQALAEVRPAVALAAEIGHLPMHALALVNEGNALTGLGRLDEALASYEQAVWTYRRTGSRMLAYALTGVGRVHGQQGRRELAQSAHEEAIRVAERSGDRQAMIPALTDLARLMAFDDPAAARSFADRALAVDAGAAQVAHGWVLLAEDRRAEAAKVAAAAAASARQLQERALLPEALELLGNATDRPAEAIREALLLWRQAGATLHVDRMVVALGSLPGATAAERFEAKLASLRHGTNSNNGISIRSLGRFEVCVPGEPPVTWQSRKARDLLRILVARRGRPVSRDELAELLWPDVEQARVAHRLSVALSTVRGVLDPRRRTDPFLLAGSSSVALDITRIDIDLEDFMLAAGHGLRLARDNDATATDILNACVRLYEGDFFGDEPFDDWAIPTREEARSTYLIIVRTLAELSRDAGRTAEAIECLHRLLRLDPYDEQSHRGLIEILSTYGRHGEARRARSRYADAMRQVESWA